MVFVCVLNSCAYAVDLLLIFNRLENSFDGLSKKMCFCTVNRVADIYLITIVSNITGIHLETSSHRVNHPG